MAGESPDKSDQRKSSGEAVPGERDPRLAVFRESASSATDGAGGADGPESGSGGSTKVATANRTEGSTAESEDGPAEAEGPGEADGDRITAAPERPKSDNRTMTLKSDGNGGTAPSWARPEKSGSADSPDRDATSAKGEKNEKNEKNEKKKDDGKESADPKDSKDSKGAEGSKDTEEPKKPQESQEPKDSQKDAQKDAKEGSKKESRSDSGDDRPEPESKPKPEAKSKPEPESASKSKAEPESKSDPETAPDPDLDPDPAPVDQATAVFRTLPKPATDQPTTALKLPKETGAAEAGTDAKAGKTAEDAKAGKPAEAGKAGKDETPAERTSTFVPLRRDDLPAASAEPAASPAAPATSKPAPAPAPAPSRIPEAERTRQQPLPPMPPLDLLAELTNKPAPPETPVRTMVRRVKIWTPLVLLAVVVFAIVQAARPLPDPELTLTAESTYAFEGDKPSLPWPDHGQGVVSVAGLGVVDTFGEQKPVPIASVTKSMTAYIIMRDHPMKVGQDGARIPVDALAEKEGGYDESGNESTLNTIKEGDKLSQKDALSALMIPSANNVARLLARWDAGSQDAFVKKMNDAAKELGMKDTTYTDPSGLDATTVSTAADQVKLGMELVKMPGLMVITQLPSWTDPSGKTWPNWNTLVPYNGAIGIKTGTTTKAGGNLLFAATKDVDGTKQYVVGAVLGQQGPSIIDAVNAASKKVLIPTRELLESKTVVKKGQTVGYVDDGLGGQTPVVATKDLKAAGWPSLKISVGLTDGGKTIPQTATAGTVVGQLTVGSGPGQVTAPVALQSDKAEPGFGAKVTRVG
ncbi:D-alanyl-D-alanine carboxypeptidase [Streptomyces sp. NPDC050509]|uniref:D-alanyl-D-alanine carboxypeptidase n=1 Tax=Streptomyces sp. NPDC050509 TaxID=3365620 RepID=UPI0037A36576